MNSPIHMATIREAEESSRADRNERELDILRISLRDLAAFLDEPIPPGAEPYAPTPANIAHTLRQLADGLPIQWKYRGL